MNVIEKFDHRPWPMPAGPWLQEQHWNNVLFVHWPTPHERIQPFIPEGLELETYDGSAWLGIVALRLSGVHLRNLPSVPFASEFLQLNLRTYVRAEDKPGIYLFSADVSNPLVVTAARQLFFAPCWNAEMSYSADAELNLFSSTRDDPNAPTATFSASYGPISPMYNAEPGTLDHWLIERYCVYTADPSGQLFRSEAHHFPWPLQRAEALIGANTLTLPQGVELGEMDPLLCHYAHGLQALMWGIERVQG